MTGSDGFERIEMVSVGALRAWLTRHDTSTESRWLVTFKKGHDHYLTYDAIVRVLIAHGWVDSQPRALDSVRSMRLISPRSKDSNWSRANRGRAEDLIAMGQMTPRGLAAVEDAKARGTWTALAGIEDGIVPDDLAEILSRTLDAKANFVGFPPSSKRMILEWIAAAKTQETRQERLLKTADMASRNERANHYRK